MEEFRRNLNQPSLADEADYVLFDPHETAAKTDEINNKNFRGKPFIVALSPDKDNCKRLLKDTRRQETKFYMGTLSLQEAQVMKSSCYQDISDDLLRNRYSQIGGHCAPSLQVQC